MKKLLQKTPIHAPRSFAFDWHKQPGAFERLAPPWETLKIAQKKGGLEDGARLSFYIAKGPLKIKWVAQHYDYIDGVQFADRSIKGPMAFWEHVHRFEDDGNESCVLIDDVQFRAPLGPLGANAPKFLIDEKIEGMFAYRAHVTKHDIERHHRAKLSPQRILITGSSGFVGSSLVPFLKSGGHQVVRALRSQKKTAEESIIYDPSRGIEDHNIEKFEGIDAVINLAGESVLGIWNQAKKKRIRDSRVITTRNLCEGLAKLKKKPKVLISASAIGLYGEGGSKELTEDSPVSSGFLGDVAREWEEATQPAKDAGIRVIHLRIGIVLSPDGAILKMMVPGVLTGLAGALGDGKQWMSWITKNDLIGLIHFCLYNESIEGAVNATGPNPETNKAFTKTVGKVLNRPTFLSVPSFLLRTVAPEISNEVFLCSQRVLPQKALAHGFEFMDPHLEPALKILLGKAKRARVKNH